MLTEPGPFSPGKCFLLCDPQLSYFSKATLFQIHHYAIIWLPLLLSIQSQFAYETSQIDSLILYFKLIDGHADYNNFAFHVLA